MLSIMKKRICIFRIVLCLFAALLSAQLTLLHSNEISLIIILLTQGPKNLQKIRNIKRTIDLLKKKSIVCTLRVLFIYRKSFNKISSISESSSYMLDGSIYTTLQMTTTMLNLESIFVNANINQLKFGNLKLISCEHFIKLV